ncbi:MAG TPA: hypothetical protein VJR95_00820 [Rhodanobacter sp.]|nr:hypothetical protein [Rhodanobacter sp.]
MLKLTMAGLAGLCLGACASQPLDRDALHLHAERDCRVRAAVSLDYAVDSTGVGLRNVAFERCLRAADVAKAR